MTISKDMAEKMKKKAEASMKKAKKKKEEEEDEKWEEEVIEVFTKPEQASISRILLEVYKTDEENFVPYEPNMGDEEETEEDEKKEEEKTEEEEEEEEEDSDLKGFKLHQGEILETYYYGYFTDYSSEHDYTEMTNNGAIKLPEIQDLNHFYKGVRLCVRKKWYREANKMVLEDMPEVLKAFITDEKFSESGMSLTLSGMSKLLDKKYKFDFHQMKRSEILKEVIKTAGLKPRVNPEGLLDDVIDYTNISKSGDDSEASGDASGAPNISSMVKQAIKGKKGAREKAEAIYSAMVNHLVYSYYACSRFPHSNEGADQAWQHGAVNCADSANIGRVAYTAGGLKAQVVHGPNHFWCEVNIDGSVVASDVTGSEGAHCVRSLGQVWDGLTKDSDNGDWASC